MRKSRSGSTEDNDAEEFDGGQTDSPPAEALAGYRQIQGLFRGILKEKIPVVVNTAAARQARMAAIRLQLAQDSEPKRDEQTVMTFD